MHNVATKYFTMVCADDNYATKKKIRLIRLYLQEWQTKNNWGGNFTPPPTRIGLSLSIEIYREGRPAVNYTCILCPLSK